MHLIFRRSDDDLRKVAEERPGFTNFRGYPVRIDDISCVQIQLIGDADGDIAKENKKYQIVSYTLNRGELEVKMLNTDLVSENLKDSASLRQAFLKNRNNKDLFRNPGRFRRIGKKE